MKRTMRIVSLLLVVVMLVTLSVLQPMRARAIGIGVALGYAAAALLLGVGTTAAIQQGKSGTVISWEKTWQETEDFFTRIGTNIWTLCNDPQYENYPAANAIKEATWVNKVHDGKIDMTLPEVQALNDMLAVAYPDGVPVQNIYEGTEYGVRLSEPLQIIYNMERIQVATGFDLATAVIYKAVYQVPMQYDFQGKGTSIVDKPNAVAIVTNGYDYEITGTHGYTRLITPVAVCEYGSEAYNYFITNLVYGSSSQYVSKPGYIGTMGWVSTYTDNAQYWNGDDMSGNLMLDGNFYNAVQDGTGYPLIRALREGGTLTWALVNYRVTALLSDAVTVDTIKIEASQMSAMIAAWENAIAQGNATEADAISFSIAQSTEAINAQLQGTISQSIEATNAASQDIVDAINLAVAAAAAGAAVGEMDLSRLTLGQAVMTRFPFCIPFDLAAAFTQFQSAGTDTPVYDMRFELGGREMGFVLDFTMFNGLAAIMRWGILVMFNIGLIMLTRKIIKG